MHMHVCGNSAMAHHERATTCMVLPMNALYTLSFYPTMISSWLQGLPFHELCLQRSIAHAG